MTDSTSSPHTNRTGVVVDAHSHPSMKTYFGRMDFTKARRPPKGFGPTGFRVTAPALRAGGIDVLCSTVYVPEKQLLDDCGLFKVARLFLPRLRRAFRDSPDTVAMHLMTNVEEALAAANAKPGARHFALCRSFAELESALDRGDLAVVHALEGGHQLAGNIDNLDLFHQRGVCMITLAHFYDVGLSPPVPGIPRDMVLRKLGCFSYEADPKAPLPPFGRDVVTRMFELGILVDLSHTTPPARRAVLDLPNPKRRPVIMSHVGVHALKADPKNPPDDEIRAIAETGGVVGTIFYNYWLTDEEHKETNDSRYVVATVKHIVNVAGEDCVAFGSDHDGLTTPPKDLLSPADWPHLRKALEPHFSAAQIDKFMGDNLMRALRDGWG